MTCEHQILTDFDRRLSLLTSHVRSSHFSTSLSRSTRNTELTVSSHLHLNIHPSEES